MYPLSAWAWTRVVRTSAEAISDLGLAPLSPDDEQKVRRDDHRLGLETIAGVAKGTALAPSCKQQICKRPCDE
jgi:hypothetical protein